MPEIAEWSYEILKHQTGETPLYVHSFCTFDVPISSGLNSKEAEATNESEDDDDWPLKSVFEEINEAPTFADLFHDNASA